MHSDQARRMWEREESSDVTEAGELEEISDTKHCRLVASCDEVGDEMTLQCVALAMVCQSGT